MDRGGRAHTRSGAEGWDVVSSRSAGFSAGASTGRSLTIREIDVLELLAQGLSTQEISEVLWVSPQAVSWHLGNMYAKFQCRNRAGLVGHAFVCGYLSTKEWPPRRVRLAERT